MSGGEKRARKEVEALLAQTKLWDRVKEEIRAIANNTCGDYVSLGRDGLGVIGARAVAKALKDNTCLKTLFLHNNSIGDEGAVALAEVLKHNTALTWLDLQSNSIGDEGAVVLAEMLKHNTALEQLFLMSNRIGPEGAAALAEMLKHNTTLEELYLNNNSIGPEGAVALAEMLKHNTTLELLDLERNSIGDEGAVALAEMLEHNTTLETLDLNNNSIGPEGAVALAGMLKHNTTMTLLYICNNGLTARGVEDVLKQLRKTAKSSSVEIRLFEDKLKSSVAVARALASLRRKRPSLRVIFNNELFSNKDAFDLPENALIDVDDDDDDDDDDDSALTTPWHKRGFEWHHRAWRLDAAFDARLQWNHPNSDVCTARLPRHTALYRWIEEQIVPGISLSRVEITKSASVLQGFNSRVHRSARRRGDPTAAQHNPDYGANDPEKRAMLGRLKSQFALTADGVKHVNVLLGWHGCDEAVTDSVTAYGAINLSSPKDRGYFGSGIYLTPQAGYAAGYSTGLLKTQWRPPNANGEHVLLLCAAHAGLAYPITRSKDYTGKVPKQHPHGPELCDYYGQPFDAFHDTHYVQVSQATDFQATPRPGRYDFEEYVLSQEMQCLPFAKVFVKVDRDALDTYLFG